MPGALLMPLSSAITYHIGPVDDHTVIMPDDTRLQVVLTVPLQFF